MGKIVKYCSACDEGFAEKFGFCPNCGFALQPFEMNPVAVETSSVVATEPPPAPEPPAAPAPPEAPVPPASPEAPSDQEPRAKGETPWLFHLATI